MEIGKQIKSLRLRRGITQEAMGQHFGVSPQAVSKWERGEAAPDIAMLPELSAYFGVTIDALFALSDDTRMERIQNMLWDVRYLDAADVAVSREFLLEKGRREPENAEPYDLLAQMEEHLADTHKELGTQYAKEAIRRSPMQVNAYARLIQAQNGKFQDWCCGNHSKLIDFLRECVTLYPKNWHAQMFLMDQLVDDYRFSEAEEVLADFASYDQTHRPGLYKGILAWHEGRREEAFAIWEDLIREFPDKWAIYDTVADYYARSGDYDTSIRYHRKAFDVAESPRFSDPLISTGQIYEIQGKYPEAIESLREQIQLYATDWNVTEGECIDYLQREIQRLKQK